jgi:putative ABC transport system permease protein
LTFACAITIFTSLLSGLAPALRVTRGAAVQGLTGINQITGITQSIRRLHIVFQSVQIGLALVLLCGAGLMVNSFLRMVYTQAGYDAKNLLLVTPTLSAKAYPTRVQQEAFFDQLQERVQILPGVRSVTISKGAPPIGGGGGLFVAEGMVDVNSRPKGLDIFRVKPEYFATLEIPLLAGRNFGVQDGPANPPVAIIDNRAAEHNWPGQSVLGKRFRYSHGAAWLTVVGVVGDIKTDSYARPGGKWLQIYTPLSQEEGLRGASLLIRTTGDPTTVFTAIRAQIAALDRHVTIRRMATFNELYGRTVITPRFYLILMSLFAALALATASVGIFGVISYSVSRRTPEIGIRLALGAKPQNIRWLVLRGLLTPVLSGVGAGIVGAFWLTQLLRSQLYQVSPYDPVTLASVAGLMLLVAIGASYVPSRRASRIDPMTALRVE